MVSGLFLFVRVLAVSFENNYKIGFCFFPDLFGETRASCCSCDGGHKLAACVAGRLAQVQGDSHSDTTTPGSAHP